MRFFETLKGFLKNANRTRETEDVGRNDDRRAVHSFASARERALSDLRRVRMLAQKSGIEPGRAPDRGSDDSLRALIPSFGELVSKRTGESEVYWNAAENAFYKVKNPSAKASLKRTSPADWIFEHVVHNILFPDTAYDLVAFAWEVGELRVVLKQTCVSSESFPTEAEVLAFLTQGLGLVLEDRYWHGNDLLAVTDVSPQSDNVLKGDDGKLYFIDPLIRLKKPALEVIDALVEDAVSERALSLV